MTEGEGSSQSREIAGCNDRLDFPLRPETRYPIPEARFPLRSSWIASLLSLLAITEGEGSSQRQGGTPFALIEELSDGSFGRIEQSIQEDIFKVPPGIDDCQDDNAL